MARTPGSGRKPGSVNKVTADVRALAGQYTEAAIKELARLSTQAESEQARVAAIKELLDRACGKAPQAVALTGAGGGPLQVETVAGAALAKLTNEQLAALEAAEEALREAAGKS